MCLKIPSVGRQITDLQALMDLVVVLSSSSSSSLCQMALILTGVQRRLMLLPRGNTVSSLAVIMQPRNIAKSPPNASLKIHPA